MVRKRNLLDQEINLQISNLNTKIIQIFSFYFFPIIYIMIINRNGLQTEYTIPFSYNTFSLIFFAIISEILAIRYSTSNKSKKLKNLSYIRWGSYFLIIWFASQILLFFLVTTNSFDFISDSVVSQLYYDSNQIYNEIKDIELFKVGIEEISILFLYNFTILIYAFYRLNRNKDQLIYFRDNKKSQKKKLTIKVEN